MQYYVHTPNSYALSMAIIKRHEKIGGGGGV